VPAAEKFGPAEKQIRLAENPPQKNFGRRRIFFQLIFGGGAKFANHPMRNCGVERQSPATQV
jgi:thermostable 8-oxoguanine DNA glycosylase